MSTSNSSSTSQAPCIIVIHLHAAPTQVTLPFTRKYEYVKEFKQAPRREDDIAIVNAGMRIRMEQVRGMLLAMYYTHAHYLLAWKYMLTYSHWYRHAHSHGAGKRHAYNYILYSCSIVYLSTCVTILYLLIDAGMRICMEQVWGMLVLLSSCYKFMLIHHYLITTVLWAACTSSCPGPEGITYTGCT